jgi:hypothetical protein
MLQLTKNKDNRVSEESGRAVQEKPKAESTHCVALHLLSSSESITTLNPPRCLIALGFAPPTILPSPSSVSVYSPPPFFFFFCSFFFNQLQKQINLFEREREFTRQASCSGVSYIGKESKILWAGIVDTDLGLVFIYLFIYL